MRSHQVTRRTIAVTFEELLGDHEVVAEIDLEVERESAWDFTPATGELHVQAVRLDEVRDPEGNAIAEPSAELQARLLAEINERLAKDDAELWEALD